MATQRRRVSVINQVHRQRGFSPPGNAVRVRELLDRRRRGRRERAVPRVIAALNRLEDGDRWETQLLARRDRMLLLLVAAGTRHVQVEAMKCGDLSAADTRGDSIIVRDGADEIEITCELLQGSTSPRRVLEDWIAVRAIQHAVPTTRATQALLEGAAIRGLGEPPAGLPLFTPLDRWCAPPLDDDTLSASAVGAIVTRLLAGEQTRTAPLPARVASSAPENGAPVPEKLAVPTLDPDAFTRGVAARRRALDSLDTVTEALDSVEDRADALLENLMRILDEATSQR
ncbi:hypothetical protein SAMN04489793_2948 [Tsukamurella tyrosinosolvens]|uniref:Uncharacterized protein n=1 Tax=Tsukamurella tyrosinosolvens TaxID=57704 RepID=A0A1H4UN56_TSUTY|nr:hypothetical protein SAMN04489793_2948 [Tsukamurella tyrosinosolvens]